MFRQMPYITYAPVGIHKPEEKVIDSWVFEPRRSGPSGSHPGQIGWFDRRYARADGMCDTASA